MLIQEGDASTEAIRLGLCFFSSMVFDDLDSKQKAADPQKIRKIKHKPSATLQWSEYTVKFRSNCQVKFENKQVYPQQSRCDVITSQQIGTLSRSACDFSPEFSQRFERFETSRVVSCFQGFLIFAKSLQEKQTKVGEFLQQTCQPPGNVC